MAANAWELARSLAELDQLHRNLHEVEVAVQGIARQAGEANLVEATGSLRDAHQALIAAGGHLVAAHVAVVASKAGES